MLKTFSYLHRWIYRTIETTQRILLGISPSAKPIVSLPPPALQATPIFIMQSHRQRNSDDCQQLWGASFNSQINQRLTKTRHASSLFTLGSGRHAMLIQIAFAIVLSTITTLFTRLKCLPKSRHSIEAMHSTTSVNTNVEFDEAWPHQPEGDDCANIDATCDWLESKKSQ